MADHGKIVGKVDSQLPQSYNHIPLIVFGPGVKNGRVEKLAMQVDVMPTLLSLLGISYEYDGFGVDLTRDERPLVFYSADNQIIARDGKRVYVYNPKMQKNFCYVEDARGTLHETPMTSAFKPLQRYVFSMIQTAQFVLKRQQ